MPEPTNTPSAPSCIIIAPRQRGGDAAGGEQDDGEAATPSDLGDQLVRCLQLFRGDQSSSSASEVGRRISARIVHMGDGVGGIAGAGLALGSNHGGALGEAPQCLTEVGGAAHERDGELPLVDVVGVVGGREHLGFVDVVDDRAPAACASTKCPMRALAMTGMETAAMMPSIMSRSLIRETPPCTRMSADPLQRHDGDCAGVLGDARLLRR